MQSILRLTVFAVALMCSTLQAAELDDVHNCSRWKTLPETARLLYLVGYSHGAGATSGAFNVPGNQIYWPKGHRIGSVFIEMNIECDRPENTKLPFWEAMINITERLNGTK
jgi:hypothetical protein